MAQIEIMLGLQMRKSKQVYIKTWKLVSAEMRCHLVIQRDKKKAPMTFLGKCFGNSSANNVDVSSLERMVV